MRIRTKFIIIFLFLSLVPLSVISVIAYKTGEEAVRKSLGSNLQLIAHQTIEKIDLHLYEVYLNIRTWSELDLVQEVITDDLDGKITTFLMGLSEEYGYFSRIDALNEIGQVVASSNPEMIGSDLSKGDGFNAPMHGKPYIRDVHFDELLHKWIVSFSFPIWSKFQEDKVIGVLHVKWKANQLINLTQLVRTEEQEKYQGQIILIRNDGLIIAAPENRKECIFTFNLLDIPVQSALLATQNKEGYLVETDKNNNKSLIGYDYSKGYNDFLGFGWSVLVIEDVGMAFASVQRLKISIFITGLLVALSVVVISLIVSRKISEPVVKISQVTSRVAQGYFDESVDYKSSDEFGSLTDNFNQMIEDLKRQRLQLIESGEHFRALAESATDAIISADNYGKIIFWNKGAQTIFGYTADETLGEPVTFLMPEQFREAHQNGIQRVVSTGKLKIIGETVEVAGIRKDKSEFPLELSLATWKTKEGIFFTGIVRDITERKIVEDSLRKSEEKFRSLFEESRDPIYISSPSGKFIDINQAGLDLLDYSMEELLRINTEELYVHKQDRVKFRELLNKEGFVTDFEVQLFRKDKTVIDCLLTTILIKASDGSEQYQGIIHDITDRVRYRKELEKALEKAEAGERIKSLFLANMSHEIRTPLNAMLGFTGLLEQSIGQHAGNKEQSYFDTIRTSGERLTRTIHEILDMSQIEAGSFNLKPTYLDLIDVTKQVVNQSRLQAEDKGVKVIFTSKVTNGIIKADKYCVESAISNILDNAIKYTNKGKIDVHLFEKNNQVILTVKDTGIGISKDYLDRIFEVFTQESSGYTKKFQGVGLGLALTRQYIELCNAAIDVESDQGIGSTFTFSFQKAEEIRSDKLEKYEAEQQKVPIPNLEKKPTVLVVEDDIGSRQLVNFFLKNDCDMIFAATVEEAKDQLSEKPVELILLDLSLEGEDDGLDLARYLRKTNKWKDIPIIATTAHAFTTDRKNCLAAGCDDYLAKPMKKQELLEKINEFF